MKNLSQENGLLGWRPRPENKDFWWERIYTSPRKVNGFSPHIYICRPVAKVYCPLGGSNYYCLWPTFYTGLSHVSLHTRYLQARYYVTY